MWSVEWSVVHGVCGVRGVCPQGAGGARNCALESHKTSNGESGTKSMHMGATKKGGKNRARAVAGH